MYIAILGRQPNLGMAELERLYGAENTAWFSPDSATVEATDFFVERLGGTQKAGKIIAEFPNGDWHRISMQLVNYYRRHWDSAQGKITLGISAYGFKTSPRDVQKTGIILKQKLKEAGISLRLVPNADTSLNTAVSHHNKLGLSANKVELLVVKASDGRVCIAESIGAQNITSLARRDQGRPKRDAFVGMLPPKLAQIMINLAPTKPGGRVLDPFCGTGVILQEAALLGYAVYGTDLSEKMIRYSHDNLAWLKDAYHISFNQDLYVGDAMETIWEQPIDAVACESYLGQPFSAPPSPEKLDQVRKNCNHIISTFLKNISSQLQPGTPLCVGVPAWKNSQGQFTHLPLIKSVGDFGFSVVSFKNTDVHGLLYYREDQIVARELLVLVKK
ncbi:MAG TPA: DNA methyltransferase [Candidatus Saccharimonadales bacterium]|nr:DNA methyltransferase [Candidatus Saccharimonadales bacterium]